MNSVEYACEECGNRISDPTVEECPHCRYNPRATYWAKRRNRYLFAAGCFISVVLAPVGLLALWRGRKCAKKAKAI
jgi:hypothetical protein